VNGQIRSYTLPEFVGHFRPKCLFRSSDDSLWIGTVQGLLHQHQGRIDRFTAADGLSGEVVTSIFEDREGSVWVSTEDGLTRFREFAVPTISVKQGLSNSSVHLVEATPDGSIWIGTADGLNRWQKGHVIVFGQRTVPGQRRGTDDVNPTLNTGLVTIASSGLPGTPRSLGHDDRGRLLASTPGGVFYFERGRFARIPGLPGGDIFSIAGDDRGKVWISKNGEGLFYSTREGAVQRVPWARLGHASAALTLLPNRLDGGLWLGFFDGGIVFLKDGKIRGSYTAADGLGNGTVYNFQSSFDSAIWAATDGGLSRVENGRVATLNSTNGLPCDSVFWAIDNDHAFWLSTGCGLLRIAHSEWDAWVRDPKHAVQTRVFDSYHGMRVVTADHAAAVG
jgi:ligand-binding sensor domain-containing protein